MKRHNKNNFGEWLRQARRDAGLTQHDLGLRIGRTGQLISSYERGASESKTGRPIRPEPDIVARIAYALRQPLNRALDAAG